MRRLPEKLKKWKADLVHSDLAATTSLGTTSVPDDVMEDGDEELLRLNVDRLTEGHRELVDEELHMVNDEELQRGQEEAGVDDDEDEN